MALWDMFRQKNIKTSERDSTKAATPEQRHTLPSRFRHRLISWLRGDYTLKNSELLFSAVTRISNALSAMPVLLYKGTDPQKNLLNDIVHFSPNPNMTSCQFFKTMEACRDTSGNCYALKMLDRNFQLTRLDVLDPWRVTPIMNEDSGELWYRYTPEVGEPLYLHNYYMLHVPFISTNGYTGINPVAVLNNTLDYSKSIRTFSAEQLEKGVNASIILEAPGNLSESQKESMIKDLMSTYKDTGGDIVLLESGVMAKSLNLSPVDAKLFEVERISRSQVAMVYNLPPHLLGDYSDTSFATMEQQMLEFLTLTMLPIVTAYEQELNRKLLTEQQRREDYGFRFNMDSILRADAKTMAEVNQNAVRGGWRLINEIRAMEGKPRTEYGDQPLVSRDLTTLEYVVTNPDKTYGGSSNAQQYTSSNGADGAQGEEPEPPPG